MSQIKFKIEVEFGAKESLDWTCALMNAPNYIFDSSAIRIVEFKWDNALTYVRLEALPHQIHSVLVVLDTCVFEEEYWTKYMILGTNILLLIEFVM